MRRSAIGMLIAILLSHPCAADEEKLVLAHYMTGMVPQTDRPLTRWIDPELADPEGSTAALGGLHQTIPMASLYLKQADLEQAVDFEIRAARQLGIDGFQFYYPLVDQTPILAKTYNRTIREFIRQSETRHSGFKISLCLAHPSSAKLTTEADRIAYWAPSIRSLVEPTRSSPAWVRHRSGALLFYLWVGDALADGVQGRANTPAEVRRVAHAYRRLAKSIGTPIEYIYQVRRPEIDAPYIASILENFVAVWGWTASEENLPFWDYLAAECRKKGCIYTQTVYPDYYTSKVYRKGSHNHAILSTREAMELGLDKIERHYRVTHLAQTQIQLLQRAVKHDTPIINYVTWNDYPEGHHLAPEVNHNFGPALVLRHFKQQWKTGEPTIDREAAVVFFKKYRHDAQPKHAVSMRIKSLNKNLAEEDHIELVTILTAPATCYLNGHSLGEVGPGLHCHSISTEPGKVRVRIVRDGRAIIEFETPENITTSPARTDRLTYSYSSDFALELEKLFGKQAHRR